MKKRAEPEVGEKNNDQKDVAKTPFMKRRFVKWTLLAVAGVLVAVVFLQFLYPRDRSLPFATIEGKEAGNKTVDELGPLLQTAFEDTEVKLVSGQFSKNIKLRDFGASIDNAETADPLMKYEWWQRLMPFSLLWIRPEVKEVHVVFDEEQLKVAVADAAGSMKADPKNGTVGINEAGEVTVTEAEDGISVKAENLAKALKTGQYKLDGTTIPVVPDRTKPAVTNQMIQGVKDKITTVLGKQLVIKNSLDKNAEHTPDKANVASWIKIGDDLSLTLDEGKIAGYLNQVAKPQLAQAGTTKVTLVDGRETGRVNAPEGRGVSLALMTADISKALFGSGPTTVTIQFSAIAPQISYNRTYSSSQAGLQAYVAEATSAGNIEIAVQQLSGPGWGASGGAGKSVVAASTYKLFISSVLFDKINASEMGWGDPILGTNVDGCLRNTIVLSANNCPEQWLTQWGRANVNNTLYAKGFSRATTFTHPSASHTSASDLQKLLIGLEGRTLFNSSDAGKLIDLMKQQVYRKGIPAGSRGVVADKVGFLWDYLNDAAIVYHPRGTYTLVILTKGESWGKIAEITRQIESIMYP